MTYEPITPAAIGCAVLVEVGVLYWVVCSEALYLWAKVVPPSGLDGHPPVTFLRPLKRSSPQLAAGIESLIRASAPHDQLIFGVDPDSTAGAICAEARGRFSDREILVVECAPAAAANPKISKLVQMLPYARHEHLLVSDSEALCDAAFVSAFRDEWRTTGADVLTAGYRFVGLATWPQQLDAAAALLTLWPGLAWLRGLGRVRLTLGACTALRRHDLEAAGGWAAFGDDLAEDHQLGRRLAQCGREIRLSRHVMTLASDALSWREYWRHQQRVAVTYRVANPAGFAASILTHALSWSVAFAVAVRASEMRFGFLLFTGAWLVRWWYLAGPAARLLAFPIPRLGRVVLVASFVETACWVLSWFARGVWWGGRWRRVSWRGKLLD